MPFLDYGINRAHPMKRKARKKYSGPTETPPTIRFDGNAPRVAIESSVSLAASSQT